MASVISVNEVDKDYMSRALLIILQNLKDDVDLYLRLFHVEQENVSDIFRYSTNFTVKKVQRNLESSNTAVLHFSIELESDMVNQGSKTGGYVEIEETAFLIMTKNFK